MRIILLANCLFLFLTAQAANYGDVVFSELMVDPEPCVSLPAVEYVEVCNRSAAAISLAGWTFVYGDKSYTLPTCTLAVDEYVVLCSKPLVSAFPTGTSVLGLSAFPTLLNSGKLMALVSSNKDLVCCLEYSDRWYGNDFKASGGWSLECIDLSNLSGSRSNWTASTDATGGTPGRRNSVSAPHPSVNPPRCQSVYVLSSKTLEIHFSEFMQPNTLTNRLNYSITPENTLVVDAGYTFPDTRMVTLQLSDTLASETIYRLSLTGLIDVSGLVLSDTVLNVGLPEKATAGSLKLNEILFNPEPGGCDYVEFVNVGSKCIDLSDIWLTTRSPTGNLNAGRRLSEKPLPCMPGSYWLLSESSDSVCAAGPFPRMPHFLDINGFPSMPDEAGSVTLISTSAEIVDEMTYDASMQFALITNPEGVALEKNRPDALSGMGSNWISANSTVHFGTPGFQNSNLKEIQYEGRTCFYTKQAWMTPNNDGRDDRVCIQYELPEACAGTIRLFDLQGRLVRTLANNEVLGLNGNYLWDGTQDDGGMLPNGRNILMAEAFTPKGRVIRNRLVLTILF